MKEENGTQRNSQKLTITKIRKPRIKLLYKFIPLDPVPFLGFLAISWTPKKLSKFSEENNNS